VPVEILTAGGPKTLPLAARAVRLPAGHPEGFPEAFTNLYSDAAEVIAASIAGTEADPLACSFPNSADGLAGALFNEALINSSDSGGGWAEVLPA
jgi:hypothetical protein